MSLLERLFFGIKRVIELDSKVETLGHATAELSQNLRDLELRMTGSRPPWSCASDGRFRPRLLRGNDPPGG